MLGRVYGTENVTIGSFLEFDTPNNVLNTPNGTTRSNGVATHWLLWL